MTEHSASPGRGYVLLGRRAGGCSEACSEGHTYSWPCEQSWMPAASPTLPRRLIGAVALPVRRVSRALDRRLR